MIKINKKIVEELNNIKTETGHYSEYGAAIGDTEFILVYKGKNIYLAHISEFEVDEIFVRLKNEK